MNKHIPAIIKAGLIAGTLDICAAMLSVYLRTGLGPQVIFRYIASAAFGNTAKTGGSEYIVAGILFHYLVAFAFTILFFMIYLYISKWISRYFIVAGLAYGAFVWCIMNLIVVPLSRIDVTRTPSTADIAREMLILMVCIGVPVAVLAKKHYR